MEATLHNDKNPTQRKKFFTSSVGFVLTIAKKTPKNRKPENKKTPALWQQARLRQSFITKKETSSIQTLLM